MSAPLASLKILDFSTLLPGPYATMMLADLGADVLRIEAPNRPDLVRLLPPFQGGQSAQHALLGRSKRSLGLDLKRPGAVEVVKRLVTHYDIVVEQFRPGVMDRLGVGYAALREANPDLIFCSLTGYGQSGPLRDRAGHDINYLALAGVLSYAGRAGEAPLPLPVQVADVGAGSLHLVVGLLAAVVRRLTTGQGGHVDISMYDGALFWNCLGIAHTAAGGEPPRPEGMMLNGGTAYNCYQTADGRYLSVGPLEPKFWAGFCHAIERPDLIGRGVDLSLANQRELIRIIQEVVATRTLAEWEAIFQQLDVCVEPVLQTDEAMGHAQAAARDMIVNVPLPDGTVQPQTGCPIKMSEFTPIFTHSGGPLGAHSTAALRQHGFSEAEIRHLLDAGVVVEQEQ